jgi:DNA-directed RNA polymerase specialized sigma24 family protein
MPDDANKEHPTVLREGSSSLTRGERLVCVWKQFGFSDAEIAEHLGWSADKVASVVVAAKGTLRREFESGRNR